MKPFDPRLLKHARRARVPVAAVAGLGAAAAGLIIVQAQLLANAIAAAFGGGATLSALRGILLALAVVVAARVAVAWGSEIASYRASAAVKAELRRSFLARAVELGPRWLAGRRSAELTALATEGVEALDGYFSKYLPQLILATIVPVAVLVRVGLADPVAGLTIAATLPLVPVFGALVGKTTGAYAEQRWRALAVLSHHFLDVVSGLPTLKVFGRSKEQQAVIGRVTGDYRRATMATLRVAFLSSLVLELVATMSVALVAVEVGLGLVYGHLGLRTGLLALILAPEAYLPLRQSAAQFHASADGLAAADAAIEVIETPAPPTGDRPAPAAHAIRVEAVSVVHPGRARPAPDRFSAFFRAGEITVLAGPSGSGKSTLLDVLLGFTRPSDGRVLVDGDDLAALDAETWRAQVGWVPQQPYLFPGTVAANIRLGWPDAPDAAVMAAARAAALDDLPLDRLVTERGGGLSSGQRRRVALARALLPGRPVLLLDEPTAGLDPETEDRVLAALSAQAAAGRIVLIAAHHPRVIAAADRVAWLTMEEAPAPAPAARVAQYEEIPA
ncbi:MAG TPA: thiol reductant ABC exporter subunit CydD [Streptosporangiaceae bacterium]|nr:thiol reductant ABC exporter subunit CydD [Streptosporangiaceae bacterium]